MDEHTTPPNPPGETGSTGAAGDDVATLRALALGLLVHRYRGPQQEDVKPELLVGRLPADLPFAPPMPEGSRLLGTLLNGNPVVVLESELAPDAVIAWYEERLLASGWRELPAPVHPRVGFVPAEEAAQVQHVAIPRQPIAAFVLGQDGPGLSVEAFAGPGARTIVHLNVHRDAATDFSRVHLVRQQARDRWAAMPALVPPPDVRHWGDGASSSSERIQIDGRLQTDLDLATVLARYGEQLEQRGWQRQDNGASGPVAWSTWTFNDRDDEPWRGLFVILKRAQGHARLWVHLIAEPMGTRNRASTGDGPRLLGWQAHHVPSGPDA